MAELDPITALHSAFAEEIQSVEVFRGDVTVVVTAERILEICRYCRDTQGLQYNFFSGVTAIDYFPQEPRFALAYHLYSMFHNRALRLKTFLTEEAPSVQSVISVYPAANWFEREAYDLMGITFEGHPDLRRLLMPDDWDGHPLRKDYPLGYETVQFSFNFDEIDRHKPYARE